MTRITYIEEMRVKVYLQDHFVGTIRQSEGGWSYFPRCAKLGGEVFKSLAACKRSLEG